ncbi:hypothetical protein EXIGLDRAFT_775702 [Exidia glandulosa HHB12029]|uniref:F-box domain-containing protein n=1 Tax=Exidia glandulosa HHB12029 TaxID=1314781 RepID=A0A165DSQ8_EXIGL|nr:hypothetical protein EXIGLDRAFT_775702 [Exidia glandulosa HHB12029]
MGERGFTRSFPHELEREILGTLGQNDLTRTALVCRRFRDTSVALLFRHIARWSVHVDDDGDAVYSPLSTSFEAVFRVFEDTTLGRHVRFLDVTIALLFETAGADLACARPLTPETLPTVWKSMPGLVALCLKGSTPTGENLGLQDVTFPHLRRLRLDEPDSCIEFIMRHLHRLQNLRLPFDTDTEVTLPVGDLDVSVAAPMHYQGPFLAFMPLLHADSSARSLVSPAGAPRESASLDYRPKD